jgi:plasmid stabilization system protein ParE
VKLNFYLSLAAEQDIEDVVDYLILENPHAASQFLDSAYESMELLSENPDMGHYREDLTDAAVKFWPFKWHYLIIYKPVNPIEIVRVISGHRDIVNLIG